MGRMSDLAIELEENGPFKNIDERAQDIAELVPASVDGDSIYLRAQAHLYDVSTSNKPTLELRWKILHRDDGMSHHVLEQRATGDDLWTRVPVE
jgi:hypothetical protein